MAGALGLLVAGCGGDDEDAAPATTAEPVPTTTAPAPVTTPPPETTPVEKDDEPEPMPRTPPEAEQQGDEEPIRSEAVFTGKGGKLTPREIRVPAFIAIRVILRSGDGRDYIIEIGGRRVAVGHARRVDEVQLAGLLPQKSYVGRSPQGNVRISATAEPGP